MNTIVSEGEKLIVNIHALQPRLQLIVKWIIASGYVLLGIGMTLPISSQALPVFFGMLLLSLVVVIIHMGMGYRHVRAAEHALLLHDRLFYISGMLLTISGMFGFLVSFYFDVDFAARNLGALFRVVFFLGLVLFTAAITRVYERYDIATWLVFGVVLACFLNVLDFFFGNSTTISLAGQNPLGISISVLLPLVLMYFYDASKAKKIVWLVILILMLVSALLTWSKAAWINVLVVSLVVFLSRLRGRKGFVASVVVLLLSLAIAFQFQGEISKIYQTELSASEGSSSNEMRMAQIKNGVEIFSEYPLGVGNATYPAVAEYLGLYFPQSIPPDPHNAYIQVLVGFGMQGFLCYLLILAYVAYRVIWLRRVMSMNEWVAAFLVIFSLYFQGLFSGELFTQPLAWVLFGYYFGKSSAKVLRVGDR